MQNELTKNLPARIQSLDSQFKRVLETMQKHVDDVTIITSTVDEPALEHVARRGLRFQGIEYHLMLLSNDKPTMAWYAGETRLDTSHFKSNPAWRIFDHAGLTLTKDGIAPREVVYSLSGRDADGKKITANVLRDYTVLLYQGESHRDTLIYNRFTHKDLEAAKFDAMTEVRARDGSCQPHFRLNKYHPDPLGAFAAEGGESVAAFRQDTSNPYRIYQFEMSRQYFCDRMKAAMPEGALAQRHCPDLGGARVVFEIDYEVRDAWGLDSEMLSFERDDPRLWHFRDTFSGYEFFALPEYLLQQTLEREWAKTKATRDLKQQKHDDALALAVETGKPAFWYSYIYHTPLNPESDITTVSVYVTPEGGTFGVEIEEH